MGAYSSNDMIGTVIGVVALAVCIWLFVKAGSQTVKMREMQSRVYGQKFADFFYKPVYIRIGAAAGGIFAIVMISMGILGVFV